MSIILVQPEKISRVTQIPNPTGMMTLYNLDAVNSVMVSHTKAFPSNDTLPLAAGNLIPWKGPCYAQSDTNTVQVYYTPGTTGCTAQVAIQAQVSSVGSTSGFVSLANVAGSPFPFGPTGPGYNIKGLSVVVGVATATSGGIVTVEDDGTNILWEGWITGSVVGYFTAEPSMGPNGYNLKNQLQVVLGGSLNATGAIVASIRY